MSDRPKNGSDLEIHRLASDDEAHLCAQLMSTSEPWITLRRGYAASLAMVQDPAREIYVAYEGDSFLGFLILTMNGAFVGYIQTICVVPERRGGGLGARMIAFAEERILQESPNVFLCVSSFNHRARALYERLGYTLVGELKDYLISGASEYLFRKSIAPIQEFQRRKAEVESQA